MLVLVAAPHPENQGHLSVGGLLDSNLGTNAHESEKHRHAGMTTHHEFLSTFETSASPPLVNSQVKRVIVYLPCIRLKVVEDHVMHLGSLGALQLLAGLHVARLLTRPQF